jgi:arginyl-tRNA synthetase
MTAEQFIALKASEAVKALYGVEIEPEALQVQVTRKEFEGDYTLVVFPLLRISHASPDATTKALGDFFLENCPEIEKYNGVKGFLNLTLSNLFWKEAFSEIVGNNEYGQLPSTGKTIMVEFSSPNTNKPLHLGHVRNNLLGKSLVQKGLDMNVFVKDADGSVWCDLTPDGLDRKLLLRSDGTSVYITQDLGTAERRFKENNLDSHIYVVGDEQNYHFQVLKLLLGKLGFPWAEQIHHLSYGMVELPEGKMKSREGTVVDADELIAQMKEEARNVSEESGKLADASAREKEELYSIIGLGASTLTWRPLTRKVSAIFS